MFTVILSYFIVYITETAVASYCWTGFIQGEKKYMLQSSEVDRWVQSGHILLIYPCPETLPLVTKGHKSFQEDA
jgi:hypothetical protein